MKIHPASSKHNIIKTQAIDRDSDIPLAYLNLDDSSYRTTIVPERDFAVSEKQMVVPYMTFQKHNIILFDEFGQEVSKEDDFFINTNNELCYAPNDIVSFEPKSFIYSVIAKRTMTYDSSKQYDFKVGFKKTASNTSRAEKLMTVFGDAAERGICPSNITINNRDISLESLLNVDTTTADFVFTTDNDVDWDLLDKHVNIFIRGASNGNPDASKKIRHIKAPMTTNNDAYGFQTLYNIEQEKDEAADSGNNVVIHNIFDEIEAPVVLYEYPNRAFVIKLADDFYDDLLNNASVLYEIMMYVYLNTYDESIGMKEWVSENIPDYVIKNNKVTVKNNFVSAAPVHTLFNLKRNEMSISKVIIKSLTGAQLTYITVAGVTDDNRLIFKKDISETYASYRDPEKPEGYLSVYTPNKNIVYFKKQAYMMSEDVRDKIHAYVNPANRYELIVEIKPLKNSTNNINITETVVKRIDMRILSNGKAVVNDNAVFVLFCKNNIIQELINKDNIQSNVYYDEKEYGTKITEIHVERVKNDIEIYDTRVRGGGIPESAKDDFNMLDIGHIYGRPYRKAGTIIITLPKRLEEHKDIIEEAIQRNIVAEEMPIIIFE